MTSSSSIVLVGSGGHAKVVLAAAQAAGLTVEALFDDAPERWGATVFGVPVRGPVEQAAEAGFPVHLAIGDNAARYRLMKRLAESVVYATVIHPSAWVAPSASIEPGVCIMAGVVIQPDAVIGAHAILNTCASVDHDCQIGGFAHLAPGVRLAGDVTVGDGTFLGVSASVLPERTIGLWSIVGAGAVVVKDLPANITAVGAPAAPIKERPDGWHL